MAAIPIKFDKATRMQAKASILLEGIQGKGKSGLALALGYVLSGGNWDDVYAVDAENKSLSLFVGNTLHTGDRVDAFNVLELNNQSGYRPSIYAAARELAVQSGGKAIINDSTTHMWQAKDGVLDMVTEAKKTIKDSYAVWGQPEIMAEKQLIVDLMRSPDIHVINTVRMKEKILYSTDTNGKTVLEKAGEQPIMMPEIAYEPDLVLTMLHAGNDAGTAPIVKVDKSRYVIFTEDTTYAMTKEILEQLRVYLAEGVDPETLLEQQRQDYIVAVTTILDSDASKKNIWKVLKKQAGVDDKVKLKDMTLNVLRVLYSQLAGD